MSSYTCPDCHRIFHYETDEYDSLAKKDEEMFRRDAAVELDPRLSEGFSKASDLREKYYHERPEIWRLFQYGTDSYEDSVAKARERLPGFVELEISVRTSLERAVGHVLCPRCNAVGKSNSAKSFERTSLLRKI